MRLFFGLELHSEIKQAVAEYLRAASFLLPGRYVRPENLHMTLCYVGEVPSDRLGELDAVGRAAAAHAPGTALGICRTGYFGRPEHAIWYLGVAGGQAYARVAAGLRTGLKEAGLPHDPGPFVPHITLARKVDLSCGLPESLIPPENIWTPQKITLFESHREDDVLIYSPIRHY